MTKTRYIAFPELIRFKFDARDGEVKSNEIGDEAMRQLTVAYLTGTADQYPHRTNEIVRSVSEFIGIGDESVICDTFCGVRVKNTNKPDYQELLSRPESLRAIVDNFFGKAYDTRFFTITVIDGRAHLKYPAEIHVLAQLAARAFELETETAFKPGMNVVKDYYTKDSLPEVQTCRQWQETFMAVLTEDQRELLRTNPGAFADLVLEDYVALLGIYDRALQYIQAKDGLCANRDRLLEMIMDRSRGNVFTARIYRGSFQEMIQEQGYIKTAYHHLLTTLAFSEPWLATRLLRGNPDEQPEILTLLANTLGTAALWGPKHYEHEVDPKELFLATLATRESSKDWFDKALEAKFYVYAI